MKEKYRRGEGEKIKKRERYETTEKRQKRKTRQKVPQKKKKEQRRLTRVRIYEAHLMKDAKNVT